MGTRRQRTLDISLTNLDDKQVVQKDAVHLEKGTNFFLLLYFDILRIAEGVGRFGLEHFYYISIFLIIDENFMTI